MKFGLTEVNNVNSQRIATYKYDFKGRRVAKKIITRILYVYDGEGTRISRTQNTVITKYINDVAFSLVQVLMETDNTGTVQAIYNYGNDLISMKRAGVYSYYHYDGLGSTKQMTDSSEVVVASYAYDGYGSLIANTGAIANAYGFTGEQQFGEADGLVFLRARYYSPQIGRFIQPDPIGINPKGIGKLPFNPIFRYIGGLNLYAYVRNNPLTYTDPEGLAPWYGHYCGPGSSPGGPIDALDGACQVHDNCYTRCGGPSGAVGVICPSLCRRDCDATLCGSAMLTDCFRSRTPWSCHAARMIITEIFCARAIISPV